MGLLAVYHATKCFHPARSFRAMGIAYLMKQNVCMMILIVSKEKGGGILCLPRHDKKLFTNL
jgi:uncharacterized membrane protein